MLPQGNIITSSYVYTSKQGSAEKRRHHAHPWIYGSRVGAWFGPFSVLQYATADGHGGQSPGNRRRSSEHDHMHAWYIRWNKASSTTKRPCSSPPKFLVTYGADNNKSGIYTLETCWCCWRPKDSQLMRVRVRKYLGELFIFRESEFVKMRRNLGSAFWENHDRELKRRRRSHPIFSWCTRRIEKMKHQRPGNS